MNSLRIKSIMGMALAIGGVSVGVMLVLFAIDSSGARPAQQSISASPKSCANSIDLYAIGPSLTVAEVEAESLNKMKSAPHAPQVPFGYSNDQWIALKALMLPGDNLHQFTTDITGGYLLARQGCVVSQVIGWIR